MRTPNRDELEAVRMDKRKSVVTYTRTEEVHPKQVNTYTPFPGAPKRMRKRR